LPSLLVVLVDGAVGHPLAVPGMEADFVSVLGGHGSPPLSWLRNASRDLTFRGLDSLSRESAVI
jgi:hypothetical protein